MHQEERAPFLGEGSNKLPESFTGFVAIYNDGTQDIEREEYFSEKTRRLMATSWPEVSLEKVTQLDLYWHGSKKITISKSDHPHIGPKDWFFSHTGYMDLKQHSVVIIARNVGYRGEDGLLYVTSVRESDGLIKGSVRA